MSGSTLGRGARPAHPAACQSRDAGGTAPDGTAHPERASRHPSLRAQTGAPRNEANSRHFEAKHMTVHLAKRYFVVGALFLLSLILYIDRAAISSAKSAIAGDLALSDTSMGWVFGAFSLGYAIAQIPWGWFADRVGPRLALAIVV